MSLKTYTQREVTGQWAIRRMHLGQLALLSFVGGLALGSLVGWLVFRI